MKIVIIDDEPLAITVLQNLLKNFPQAEIVGTFNSTSGLAEKLNVLKPDVVFSDIQMPGETGLEFIKNQYPMPYAVIFTTAYTDYAAEAFEFEALDYLVKPISPDRLTKAIKRLEEYISLKNSTTEVAETQEEYVYVKVDGEFQKILYKDILYVEAFADYVKIWTSPEKRVVTLQTMRNMENGLPQSKFIRVHRSFIISIDKIKSIQNSSVIIAGDVEVPIGKNYKESISALLEKNRLNHGL
jgi:two-component system LytT family response regulator